MAAHRSGPWVEVGDRVFSRRYAFYDQQIGVVLGAGRVLLVDTRTTHAQAGEILDDLRSLTADPVAVVVNTHGHHDHAFGNRIFRPATIWAHARGAAFLRTTGEDQRTRVIAELPALADELRAVEIDLPDQTFDGPLATLEMGDRLVELHHLGRGHTDGDIVVRVPDAAVVFAGDLLESDAVPSFGDAFPLDWPDTVERMLPLIDGGVVPGHGSIGDRRFAEAQLGDLRAIAGLARAVHAGELDVAEALGRSPFPLEESREPLARAIAQLRGELDVPST
jgi:glyoxylase-like metal-dependent hydrolase (beta-lactamase superfamily II)